jgi:nicotinate-nucleotide pyrophosphorylase (carboxylating)
MSLNEPWLDADLVARALAEDIGRGDVTTLACIPETARAHGRIVARRGGSIAGLPLVAEVYRQVDPQVTVETLVADGAVVAAGTALADLAGSARSLLTGERVALNFLGRLSGIATLTARCVAAIADTGAHIVDTRKTTPGLRALEKYAVRMGGGRNHRFGLDDGILIKDNHIVASGGGSATGGIAQAVANARAHAHHLLRIEVECDTLAQVREALDAGVSAILLDNMAPDQLTEVVAIIRATRPDTVIEASGGMGTDPEKLRAVATTGVDLISIGALTHSAANLDVALDFLPVA